MAGRTFTTVAMLVFAAVFIALWVHVVGALGSVRGFGTTARPAPSDEVDYWSQQLPASAEVDVLT